MFRLLLLSLLLLWSAVQVFIGLEVPSSKRIHYTMVNNYGLQALSMNQQKISLAGVSYGSNSYGGTTAYAFDSLRNSQSDRDIPSNSDSLLSSQSLRTSKNIPVLTADSLDAISEENLMLISNSPLQEVSSQIKKANVLVEQDVNDRIVASAEVESTVATLQTRQVEKVAEVDSLETATLGPDILESGTLGSDIVVDADVSSIAIDSIDSIASSSTASSSTASSSTASSSTASSSTASNSTASSSIATQNTKETISQTSLEEAESFGFGIQVDSLIDQLEAVQEDVNSELVESELRAKAHSNIALHVPSVPEESTVIDTFTESNNKDKDATLVSEEQEQKFVFEAQSMQTIHAAMGGFAQAEKQLGQSVIQQRSFKVALASLPARAELRNNQRIADNLAQTSTTVVSGLEITLNPNEAVRRDVPVEQQAFLWPLPTKGRLTSGYGHRRLAITNNQFHRGIDIAVKTGTPILAVKDGVVEKAGWEGGYGYVVYLRHNDGTESRYAHMSRIIVENDEWVNQGQWLGLVGSTGLSTGPHLHFELHLSGNAVDPSKHLVFSGERLATR